MTTLLDFFDIFTLLNRFKFLLKKGLVRELFAEVMPHMYDSLLINTAEQHLLSFVNYFCIFYSRGKLCLA